MVRSVTLARPAFADVPARFEAGTPNIEGAVGLAAALDYLSALDRRGVAEHERQLGAYASERIAALPGARLVGRARDKAPIVSFTIDGMHPHDIGTILDQHGVAIRAGHHCAQPLMDRLGVTGTARASLALYNTTDDIDALAAGLQAVRKVLG
jgi:cysteine desulfurase/selenocysteine lyase